MEMPTSLAKLIASSDQLKYNILVSTPTNDGSIMTHDEVKKVMQLSDATAELYRANYNNDVQELINYE